MNHKSRSTTPFVVIVILIALILLPHNAAATSQDQVDRIEELEARLAALESAAAGAPTVMTYQGYLTDASDAPLDGSANLVFTIYPTQASSTVEWTETHNGVSVEDGYFTVLLGETTALNASVFSGTERWLEVTVNGTAMPRQRIASVPYALQAQDGVPAGAIVMWSGSIGSIPDGWALCDGSNGTPDLRNRFIVGAGSSYSVGNTGGSATMAHTHQIDPPNTSTSEETSWRDTGSWSSHNKTGEGGDHHRHTLDITPFTSGAASNVENRPPYYALAYIMKLP